MWVKPNWVPLVTGQGNQWAPSQRNPAVAKNELHSFPWCVWKGSCSMDAQCPKNIRSTFHLVGCEGLVTSCQLWTSLHSKLPKSDCRALSFLFSSLPTGRLLRRSKHSGLLNGYWICFNLIEKKSRTHWEEKTVSSLKSWQQSARSKANRLIWAEMLYFPVFLKLLRSEFEYESENV